MLLSLVACGQLNREYILKIDAAEESKVTVNIKLEGLMLEKSDSDKLDNRPEVDPTLSLPIIGE
jgi:hypothetical protein